MSPARAIFTVWLRYFAVFRKNLWYGIVTTFVEPLLYLSSFGFGLGAMVGDINAGDGLTVSYRSFVLAGIAAQSILFVGFFESAYGSFIRMYYQKIFQAIAVTPVTLSEVLWGELFWSAARATLSAGAVLALGAAIGDFPVLGAALMLPFVFVCGLVFASLGLLFAGLAKTIESINYPQYLFIFPMFLFCGVYFPLSNLPDWLESVIAFLPLTPMLSILRTVTLGFPFEPQSVVILAVWAAVLIPLSRRAMIRRLVA